MRLARRGFLGRTAGCVSSILFLPRHVVAGAGPRAPSERLNLLGIGVGGVGFGQLQACERAGFDVVALCDVDDAYAKKAFDRWPRARRYRDFREALRAEKECDAVYIGTPDHTHAVIAIASLKMRRHVCCVKPLARTIEESRAIVRAAKEAGTATQVTARPNTSEEACRTCELIWAGAIGEVREVHVWSNRPLWPQGMERPPGEDAIPETLDWDLWIGPSPMRPFKAEWPEGHLVLRQVPSGRPPRAVYHPWNFRGWWEFGTGALGDMGCHHLNTPFRALKLAHPVRIHASTTRVFPETAPLASIVTYDFAGREGMPPVRVVWYDGGLRPVPPRGWPGGPLPPEGTLYVGTEGGMLGSRILSPERAKKAESIPRTLPRRSGTWGEWMEACRGGEPAGCTFEWAGLLAEFVLLGNIAIRTGKILDWEAAAMRFSNDAGADDLLRATYRPGWSLEA